MFKPTVEELAEIIRKHERYLVGHEGGERANLRDANLQDANLWGANLQGANLRDANLQDANLQDANLWGANLWGANLWGANLQDANLQGADLQDANLRDANLQDANLWGANLQDANLQGANLQDANLQDADLWGTHGNRLHIRSIQVDKYDVTYTHDILQIGCQRHTISEWWQFNDSAIDAMDIGALEWWRKWKPVLKQIIEMSPAMPAKEPE